PSPAWRAAHRWHRGRSRECCGWRALPRYRPCRLPKRPTERGGGKDGGLASAIAVTPRPATFHQRADRADEATVPLTPCRQQCEAGHVGEVAVAVGLGAVGAATHYATHVSVSQSVLFLDGRER